MSAYPSTDSYSAIHSSTTSSSYNSGNGDVDIDSFPLPPNLRSMSMSDQPIVDPDFGWFDSYPPTQFTDFTASSPSSSSVSSGSVGQPYEWYDLLPPAAPPAAQPPPASVLYPADGARPHPAHLHNGSSMQQQPPAHGLAPIIPPQQRSIPTQQQQASYGRAQPSGKADFVQPPYSQPHPRQPQQQQQQQPTVYDQPPPYQHAASFPPPSYPPQHPPSEQQQQLAQTFTHHSRRASTPSQSIAAAYSAYTAATPPPGPYSSGRQSMYGAGDHSPVSHVSSASSLSSHSSSSSESGVEGGVRHKRKQSTDSNTAEVNGVEREHSPTDTSNTVKGKGRAVSKKQRAANSTANHNNNTNKAKPNNKSTAAASTAPDSSSTAITKQKPAHSTTSTTTARTTLDCWGDGDSMTSVHRSAHTEESTNIAWPMQSSTYNNMQQYFVSLILAMKQPDNQTITDIIHLMAHAMEVAPAISITYLLRRLGYVPTPATADSSTSSDDGDNKRVVWRTPNPLLPYMTLPHHFRLNWSVSPETTLPEDTSVINFPTLTWWRAKEVRFVRRSDGFVQAIETHFHPNPNCTPAHPQPATDTSQQQQQSSDSPFSTADNSSTTTPTPQTPATPSTEPASPSHPPASSPSSTSSTVLPTLPPSDIDMSVLDLPCHVEVNSAFERMFGYSQSEIRILFIRHGKQALARLADAQQFRRCHELAMRDACEGQHEFSHVIDVRPKYGGTMKSLMHHKLVVGNEGLIWKKLYMWIPLTKSMKEAYVQSKLQSTPAGSGGGEAGRAGEVGGVGSICYGAKGGGGVSELKNGLKLEQQTPR